MRAPCVDKNGLKKGAWSEEEDNKLRAYILRYGHWNWRLLPQFAGLARCGKSCRLRWLNYLKPGVKRGDYTKEEEDLIAKLHDEFGNKWSVIAAKLPGRTDNDIKNYWHTNLKKRNKTNTAENSTQRSCQISTVCSRNHVTNSEDLKLVRKQKNFEPCDHVHILESSGSNAWNHGLLNCDSEDSVSSSGSVQELERMSLLPEETALAKTYDRRVLELFQEDGNYERVSNSSDSFVGFEGSFWNDPFLVDMSTTASYSQDHSFSVPLDDEGADGMFSGYLFT